jgi:uncharacterized protein YbbK (DUF523 family)
MANRAQPRIEKPRVGISQCLLGDRVRYDGDSKPLGDNTLTKLNDVFELVPVCPEVEAGLGIPRPPVQLTGDSDKPSVTGRDDPTLDVTEALYIYSANRADQLADLSGYIFKSRSPSCGLHSTPVFINNEQLSDSASGVFARQMRKLYPGMPMAEETDLEKSSTQFIADVINYFHQQA